MTSSIFPNRLHENCTRRAQPLHMRNPIQPTPERPFPLPDRILSDGWWLTELPGPVVEGRQHVWVVMREEGAIERDRGEGERKHFLARA